MKEIIVVLKIEMTRQYIRDVELATQDAYNNIRECFFFQEIF